MKEYRKGLTAVVDRCVYISYNRHHAVPKSYICCCSGRDSCMLTSRCMRPWLRSAPYPALCPCEPLRPVGDMQALSYGARSRPFSPLPPASRSQPRSIVERPRSGPMCRVHIRRLHPFGPRQIQPFPALFLELFFLRRAQPAQASLRFA